MIQYICIDMCGFFGTSEVMCLILSGKKKEKKKRIIQQRV